LYRLAQRQQEAEQFQADLKAADFTGPSAKRAREEFTMNNILSIASKHAEDPGFDSQGMTDLEAPDPAPDPPSPSTASNLI
jgi:hypothetical protein